MNEKKRLPFGMGRLGTKWWVLVGVSLTLVTRGIIAYSQQASEGEVVTGMRDIGPMGGAAWGLYIVFVVYFVGISFTGICLASLIRLLNLKVLRPIVRPAEVMTVIALILGALAILADVGQPGRAFLMLLKYARPQSPFFGTFAMVISGYLFGSLVYLYLHGRPDAAVLAKRPGLLQRFHRWWAAGYGDTPPERARRVRSSFWLSVALLPLLITATSTLGFVFGLQGGRPGWFGSLQAPGFVVMAGLSGVGVLILIAAGLRQALGEKERLNLELFRWLADFLLVLLAGYLYFLVVEWLTNSYAAGPSESLVSQAILAGENAWIFWGSVAFLTLPAFLLLLQRLRGRVSLPLIVACGVMVNLAAIAKRFLIVVPSQTHGMLLPYSTGSYTPSLVEWEIVIGLVGLGGLLFALFVKGFPILELDRDYLGGTK